MKKLLSITINTQGFETTKKGKTTYRGFISQKEHNTRKEEMDDDYLLKPEKAHLNLYYENDKYKTEDDIKTEMTKIEEDYKNYYKRKMPKNYKPLLNGLITFSETMQQDIKKYGREEMMKHIHNFLKEEYGIVCSLDLHMDETTPHFHFQVINYDYNKHKTHSQLLDKSLKDPNNKYRVNYTQDRLANYLQNHLKEFDYERGEILSIKQYHSKRKAQQEHLKKLEQKTKEQEEELIKLRKQVEDKNKNYSELETKYKKLEIEYEGLEDKFEKMKDELIEEYKESITEILDDLQELGQEKDAIKFLGLVVRYAKGEQAKKLHNLIAKYGKRLSKIDRRKSRRNTM